jgi:hypothetical protein
VGSGLRPHPHSAGRCRAGNDETVCPRPRPPLCEWSDRAGIARDVEAVLDPETVERFVRAQARELPEPTVATWRSDLRRLGPVLTKYAPWEPPAKRLARPTLPRPYSERELRLIHRDAPRQQTAIRSQATVALVVLGLGAGLDGRWNCKIHGTDVDVVDSRVVVRVPEPHPRQVPVRDAFAESVLLLADDAGPGLLVGRAPHDKNLPNEIARSAVIHQGRLTLNAARLRSTWLVAQLSAGTHIAVVTRAAGMTRIDTLRDLMQYVREPTDTEAAEQLRRA